MCYLLLLMLTGFQKNFLRILKEPRVCTKYGLKQEGIFLGYSVVSIRGKSLFYLMGFKRNLKKHLRMKLILR